MADNSEVQAVSEVFFTNCWTHAAAVLLVYDHILTFNSEVTLFWMGGRLSGATILFLLNRYFILVSLLYGLFPIPSSIEVQISIPSIPRSICVAEFVLRALQYLPWAAFSALRSYALCPGPYRWPVSATVFAFALVPLVADMWANLYPLSIVNNPQQGMTATHPIPASMILQLEVATRSSLIASDLVVFCVTWFRTFETAKLSLRSLGKETFAGILLLDGVNRALLVLSVLQMAFTLTGTVPSFTATLTSRFLIDLQRTQRKLAGSFRSISLGEVVFQPQTSSNTSRFIGSLGPQISFHEDGIEEGEVEDMS
ncbi:hypothetical protein BD310DRAFT_1012108 [Dichomitus squalens]|uniref:DUF6533 domain-containing protein n=1 Tax=Dichomitus squalens TaxID=114155 RepID=A0A4Q9P8W0_9APHY|nr:hypothetical protein BD310DRAFT_1012108 [Dichomitus squalens]